jgi:hypothetical protein
MRHPETGFTEEFAKLHRHQFQLGQQSLELGRGKRGEQLVLAGIMRVWHDRKLELTENGLQLMRLSPWLVVSARLPVGVECN